MGKNITPEIRFDGYDKPWEQHKFIDVFDGLQNNTLSRAELNYDGGTIKNIHYGDVLIKFGDYIDASQEKMPFITDDSIADNFKRSFLQDGDIVIADTAEDETVGKCTEIQGSAGLKILSGLHTLPYRPKDVFGPKFMGYYINSSAYHSQLLPLMQGTKVTSISKSALQNTEINVPNSIKEQTEIGKFFSNLDNLISLEKTKCENAKKLKQSMLVRMFPKDGETVPEIRFAGFTEDWEQRKLGDMASFSKGSGYSKGDLKEDGTPIILYGRLYTKYETVISEVDTFADVKKGSVFSKGGEVIVPASGETAEDISIASVVEKSGILLGGDLNVITPSDDMDSSFLAISISNGKPHNDMAKMAQGKSIVHLHNSDLEKIDLSYPSYKEQKRISGFFSYLDSLIALHQRKYKKLIDIKKALLEKMIGGGN